MAPGLDDLPPHRQLRQLLEVALDCLDEATSLDDTIGVLPHWARGQLRTMAEDLSDLLDRIARESAALRPLGDDEVPEDAEEDVNPGP